MGHDVEAIQDVQGLAGLLGDDPVVAKIRDRSTRRALCKVRFLDS
jgi:hypothetical protein